MVNGPIYIVHPPEVRFPGIEGWIVDVEAVVSNDPDWTEYPLRWIQMRDDYAFRVTDILSRVASALGPVVIFRSAQTALRQEVRQRLSGRTVVRFTEAADSTQLWSDLREARDLFASGDPFLPRRLVAAMLIVRKLLRHKYWGGSHEKNFIWGDDIANGRGVDPTFKDIAQDVANFLRLKGLLLAKYGGGRKGQKYALNPERKDDIHRLANDGEVSEAAVQQWFYKDDSLQSARVLDKWDPI